MNMKKIKGLEYQSPNRRTVKPPSVFIPILLLIGLAVFFVFASEVKGFQLFRVIPDPIETPAPPILNEIADVVETQEIFEATETTEPVIADVPALKGLEASLFEVLASTEGIWSANQWSIDQITYNADQDQALVWLGAVDPETGLVMASEPLQVYAQKTLDGTSWEIVLEDNPAFAQSLSLSDLAGSDVVSKSEPTRDIKTTTPRIYGGSYLH